MTVSFRFLLSKNERKKPGLPGFFLYSKGARKMAFFNIVKNEVSGNVGQYNGIKSKGGNYIRRKRMSKTARLPVQRESFKAFAALRRQSLFQRDKLGEIITPFIKYSERPYVIANMLKKWITNHQFTPENFVNMWTPKIEYSLENVAYDQERKIFSFSIKPEPGYIVTLEREILLFVADSQGYGHFFSKQILSESSFVFAAEIITTTPVYLYSLLYTGDIKHPHLDSAKFVQIPYPLGT